MTSLAWAGRDSGTEGCVDARRRASSQNIKEMEARLLSAATALRSQLDAAEVDQLRLAAELEAAQHSRQETAELLAAAAHDLLQPLSSARIFLATLARQRLRAPNRFLVDRTDGALSSAEALLTGLLEISSLEAGGLTSEVTSFPVSSLLFTLRDEFEPLAIRKGVSLRVVYCTKRVQSDAHLLRRIIQNLLANSIRYTEAGKVLLGCRLMADAVRIEVWDTGPGIPPEKFDRIFEAFERLRGPSENADSVGLGLAIVRRLTRLLGHPLMLRSEVGRGSMFGVTVPYGRAMPALRPDDIVPPPRSWSLGGRLILVVEDDLRVAEAMSGLLKSWGCQVAAAASGTEALDRITGGLHPDLVLADFHLGGVETGLEVIDRIRVMHSRAIPALLVTADAGAAIRREARKRGCQVLRKPLKAAEIHAAIGRLIAVSTSKNF
ncbi:hybrid sensor histidine kinase/response regulator [Microvirga massiliensis]|uniref:ATP-binding response regulator n=1 Tax=Microvirga massiliensis TaxID=1033741 RepID=UPI00164DA434|nr:hybrid sensor histidine kinase/response regulator [Microvirga massiliensis]